MCLRLVYTRFFFHQSRPQRIQRWRSTATLHQYSHFFYYIYYKTDFALCAFIETTQPVKLFCTLSRAMRCLTTRNINANNTTGMCSVRVSLLLSRHATHFGGATEWCYLMLVPRTHLQFIAILHIFWCANKIYVLYYICCTCIHTHECLRMHANTTILPVWLSSACARAWRAMRGVISFGSLLACRLHERTAHSPWLSACTNTPHEHIFLKSAIRTSGPHVYVILYVLYILHITYYCITTQARMLPCDGRASTPRIATLAYAKNIVFWW